MSEKSKTNKKWTSSKEYRESHDRVFRKKSDLTHKALYDKWVASEEYRAKHPNCLLGLREVGLARLALAYYTDSLKDRKEGEK